jgi:hypothetical protein
MNADDAKRERDDFEQQGNKGRKSEDGILAAPDQTTWLD